eukprot:407256_1
MAQLVNVWRGSGNSAKEIAIINALDIPKMNKLTKAECEYIIGELFVRGFLDIQTRFTTYCAVCVIVAGTKASMLNGAYRNTKGDKAAPITINLPVLGKKK